MPRVSVVIPTYNYSQFLAESLDSVLAQDYGDFEVIVVDDGSTDNTRDVLAGYGFPVRCIHQDHGGPSVARNTGMAAARGDLIAFQDADDVWMPGSLGQRVRMMELHPELAMVFGDVRVVKGEEVMSASFLGERKALVGTDAVDVGEDRFIFSRSIFPDLLRERFIPVPTMLVRRRCFDEVGFWDITIQSMEDYELQLRMARHYRLGYVHRVMAECRLHGDNTSSDLARSNRKRIELLQRFEDAPELSDRDRALLRKRISALYVESGWFHRKWGNYQTALSQYRRGWTYNRTDLKTLMRCATCAGLQVFKRCVWAPWEEVLER